MLPCPFDTLLGALPRPATAPVFRNGPMMAVPANPIAKYPLFF
jgi:hypothetical protein